MLPVQWDGVFICGLSRSAGPGKAGPANLAHLTLAVFVVFSMELNALHVEKVLKNQPQ
jgi:hypothetical protein